MSFFSVNFMGQTIRPANDDERFMLEALKEALKAYDAGEVPIGAVLVREGVVIAKGYNQVELLQDATAHAELLCLTAGSTALNNWRLLDTTLYTTLEPCAMCAGAMFLSRITRLVWAAEDIRHGANGSWVDIFSSKHPTHHIAVTKHILRDLSSELLKDFFKKRREVELC